MWSFGGLARCVLTLRNRSVAASIHLDGQKCLSSIAAHSNGRGRLPGTSQITEESIHQNTKYKNNPFLLLSFKAPTPRTVVDCQEIVRIARSFVKYFLTSYLKPGSVPEHLGSQRYKHFPFHVLHREKRGAEEIKGYQ